MSDNKKQIFVIGAGVAGLTAAYLLTRKGFKVTVIERENDVGGLARSFYYDGYVFDIGPHRFHTDNKDVIDFIKEILGDNLRLISRKSGVWMFDRYYDWPLRANILTRLPLTIIPKIIRDLIFKKQLRGSNFEDFIIAMYGKTIYEVFFRPYTEKFLKEPPSKIDYTWARVAIDRAIIDQRLKMDNLGELIKNIFLSKSIKTDFFYPQEGGIGAFSRELKIRIQEMGGAILLSNNIKEIRFDSNKIEELITEQRTHRPDIIIWTAPITTLCRLLKLPTFDLRFLSLICYNFVVSSLPKNNYQWCYFGKKAITFSRTSSPALFSKVNTHNNKMGICVEVPCLENGSFWQNPEVLTEAIKRDLFETRQIVRFQDIQAIHIERISNSYPIYELGYQGKTGTLKNELNKFKNLILLGRSANFWYNNMDHSIKAAMDVAKTINNVEKIA